MPKYRVHLKVAKIPFADMTPMVLEVTTDSKESAKRYARKKLESNMYWDFYVTSIKEIRKH